MSSGKRRHVEVDPRALVLAVPLAQGFAELGLAGYNQFARHFEGAQNQVSVLSPDDSAIAIAAATNMAFAAELFLKILILQATGTYVTEHVLAQLANHLPKDCSQTHAFRAGRRHKVGNRSDAAIGHGSGQGDEARRMSEVGSRC